MKLRYLQVLIPIEHNLIHFILCGVTLFYTGKWYTGTRSAGQSFNYPIINVTTYGNVNLVIRTAGNKIITMYISNEHGSINYHDGSYFLGIRMNGCQNPHIEEIFVEYGPNHRCLDRINFIDSYTPTFSRLMKHGYCISGDQVHFYKNGKKVTRPHLKSQKLEYK